jgi:bud site selection protein 31
MPPVRTRNTKKPPPTGFSDIEPTLLEYQAKLRDAHSASTEGRKKHESLWPIFQLTHARTRYIYDLYYTRSAISKPLYEYLLKNGYADPMLIAKWKKQGYEKLCCLRCVQGKETNFGGVCVCRVPKAGLKRDAEEGGEGGGGEGGGIQCVNCGCRGCASSD